MDIHKIVIYFMFVQLFDFDWVGQFHFVNISEFHLATRWSLIHMKWEFVMLVFNFFYPIISYKMHKAQGSIWNSEKNC